MSELLADLIGPDGIIIVVVIVVVLLFGGSKLPKLARGLGSASHEFKKGLEEGDKEGAAATEPAKPVSAIPEPSKPEPAASEPPTPEATD